jgi:hypothetical protein
MMSSFLPIVVCKAFKPIGVIFKARSLAAAPDVTVHRSGLSAIAFLARTAQMHPLREILGSNREAGNVAAWICKLAEPIQESQSLKHSRVDADAD